MLPVAPDSLHLELLRDGENEVRSRDEVIDIHSNHHRNCRAIRPFHIDRLDLLDRVFSHAPLLPMLAPPRSQRFGSECQVQPNVPRYGCSVGGRRGLLGASVLPLASAFATQLLRA